MYQITIFRKLLSSSLEKCFPFSKNFKLSAAQILTLTIIASIVSGCKKFVEVGLADSQVIRADVFASDQTAQSAITGIYYNMLDGNFFSGNSVSTISITGLSADELIDYTQDPEIQAFQNNALIANNKFVSNQWSHIYRTIYQANAAIEGLNQSSKLSSAVKEQLLGECHFIRAFGYFYLVNLFGDVPLLTSTDYSFNSSAARTSTEKVYEQIINDLLTARAKLKDTYPTSGRVRPNKAAATALLSRVYLYRQMWDEADTMASEVINSSNYGLVQDLSKTFLKESSEAIWQLMPIIPQTNTNEARQFVIVSSASIKNALRPNFVGTFEPDDKRLSNWIGKYMVGNDTIFYPFKYKVYQNTTTISEYTIVLRLAEQFLNRAEARAHKGELGNAISDIDLIRNRAGIALISVINPGISQQSLLDSINLERSRELFTEGHRWFDLNRTGRALNSLSSVKAGFTKDDELYPIPQDELNANQNLIQNPQY